MTTEIKNKIRPLYSELQGYLSQAPTTSTPHDSFGDKSLWLQYNEAVDLLSSESGKDYSRFKIEPINDNDILTVFISRNGKERHKAINFNKQLF